MSEDFDTPIPLTPRKYSNVMFGQAEELWSDLMKLADASEAFFYSDQSYIDSHYRIFNYRMASYTDFLQPSAMECRGIMFELDGDNGPESKPLRLVCRPPVKFFNLGENPITMELDPSKVGTIQEKADGSLISSYQHINKWGFGSLALKSKGSVSSDQAVAALEWLKLPENLKLHAQIEMQTMLGYTINMEWCAPDNRIVLAYDKPQLRIHSSRCNSSGQYRYLNWYKTHRSIVDVMHEHWVKEYQVSDFADSPEEFLASVADMTDDIEGYVVNFHLDWHDVIQVKLKTLHYLTLHRSKDSINSDRRLYEVVLAEATDDLRTLFVDDPQAIERIVEMETKVEKLYNHLVDTVERYYARNKDLERKDYAIKGQQELSKLEFGLAMSLYVGRKVNYKEFMMNKWKEFGINDTPTKETEEE